VNQRAISLLAAFAIAIALFGVSARPSSAATLPRLEADALGGTHVVLPTDAAGKPLIVLIAYTRESGHDLKAWARALMDDRATDAATLYVVVVADRIALSSRRHIRSVVEGAAVGTKEQIDRNVLITFSGDGWRELMAPGDKRAPGVLVCDGRGDVMYAKRTSYSAQSVAEVEKMVR